MWLADSRSLYDALGSDYTLVRLDPTVPIAGIVEAAARRSVPLLVLDVAPPNAASLYACKLALVRPDQHVAWRGDAVPAAPMDLIDRVRGAQLMPARKAA